MTMARVHKHEQHWWEELDELDQLEVDFQNLRGMTKVIKNGLLAAREDIRTSRGNHRYPKHFYVSH